MGSVSVHSLTIFSSDIEKTRAFYGALGFEIEERFSGWTGPIYYQGRLGESGWIEIWPSKSTEKSDNKYRIGFRVRNVHGILVKLREMEMQILRPAGPMAIRTQWAGCRYGEVQDPDGRIVKLYEAD